MTTTVQPVTPAVPLFVIVYFAWYPPFQDSVWRNAAVSPAGAGGCVAERAGDGDADGRRGDPVADATPAGDPDTWVASGVVDARPAEGDRLDAPVPVTEEAAPPPVPPASVSRPPSVRVHRPARQPQEHRQHHTETGGPPTASRLPRRKGYRT